MWNTKWLLLTFCLLVSGAATTTMAQQPKENEAPYVGQYTLNQGGTDAAGGVNLLLFPKGDYAIVYFGGMQQGTWKPVAGGMLELHEWPGEEADFAVYARHDPALGNELKLDFSGFEESYAKVGLVEHDEHTGSVSLHPAFNDDANCYASAYSLKQPAGKLKAIQLAVYQEPTRAKYQQIHFTKKLLYSFALDKRYNHYQVVHIATASKPVASYIGRFVKNELTLYPADAALASNMHEDSYGERREISAIDLKEMRPYIKKARQPLPAQLAIRNYADDTTPTYERIPGTSKPLQESTVQLLAPLFVARCE